MALILKKPLTLTIYLQICIIMSIFCSTGCAAGCLSYGNACWGAHGKRSDIRDKHTMRILTLLNGFPQNGGIIPSSKAQWVLSRFNTGQPMLPLTDKYHVRWDDFPNDKSYLPLKWDYNTAPIADESIESIRSSFNNRKENNARKISNIQGTMRNMNQKFKDNSEILLISPGEYDKPINDPQKLDILKLLNERNEDTK